MSTYIHTHTYVHTCARTHTHYSLLSLSRLDFEVSISLLPLLANRPPSPRTLLALLSLCIHPYTLSEFLLRVCGKGVCGNRVCGSGVCGNMVFV